MKIIKAFFEKIKNLDNKIKKIIHVGFIFSFLLNLIAVSLLFTYEVFYSIPDLFYAGISLFRTSLMFACSFIISGISFDTILKEII